MAVPNEVVKGRRDEQKKSSPNTREPWTLSGTLAGLVFSAIVLSSVPLAMCSIRTIIALPMTVALATAWEYIPQRSLPTFGSIMRIAWDYARVSWTGIGLFSITLGLGSSLVLTVAMMLGSRRFKDLLLGPDGNKTFRPSDLPRYVLPVGAGAMAAIELGVGLAALRWWYDDSLDAVTSAWARMMVCGVFGGVATMFVQSRKFTDRSNRELGEGESSPDSPAGTDAPLTSEV